MSSYSSDVTPTTSSEVMGLQPLKTSRLRVGKQPKPFSSGSMPNRPPQAPAQPKLASDSFSKDPND